MMQVKKEVKKEVRSQQRIKLQKLMFAEYDGQRVSVHDLSLDGAFVAARPQPPVGDNIHLKIWLGTRESIEADAVVRRVTEGRGIGVEFLEMDEEASGRLKRFLKTSRHGPGPGPA